MTQAIFFDKQNNRTQEEIELPLETITKIKTDTTVAIKITFKLAMYDKKGRAVYVEQTRTNVDVSLS